MFTFTFIWIWAPYNWGDSFGSRGPLGFDEVQKKRCSYSISKEKRFRDSGILGGLGEKASVRPEGLAGTPVTFREDKTTLETKSIIRTVTTASELPFGHLPGCRMKPSLHPSIQQYRACSLYSSILLGMTTRSLLDSGPIHLPSSTEVGQEAQRREGSRPRPAGNQC